MSKEEDIKRAEKAKLLLENPLIIEAFEALEEDHFKRFSELKYKDADDMLELNRSVQNLKKLKEQFESIIINGKVAERFLEKLKNKMG
jgi:thymidine phosphorylase